MTDQPNTMTPEQLALALKFLTKGDHPVGAATHNSMFNCRPGPRRKMLDIMVKQGFAIMDFNNNGARHYTLTPQGTDQALKELAEY